MQSTQPVASSSTSTPPVPSSADRLYVGNLSPTIDEFTLIQIFSKYGKITKLDFMFHKTGVLKGKPRGFAFVQFSDKSDALKAMVKLHDRLLRGRKLVVTFASSAPPENAMLPLKGRRPTEPAKTTTLSLLKSSRKPQSAAAQIAAMEAKLASMARSRPADQEAWAPTASTSSPAPDSTSLGASPVPKELLGDNEAQKAAEDLEMEMQAELASLEGSRGGREQEVAKGEDGGPLKKAVSPPQRGRSTPPAEKQEGGVDGAGKKIAGNNVLQAEGPVKRGLASLPKKPVF
ncbi:hypothetical protein IAT38_006767 [Cryptococcus sp. DSM 104549]